MMSDEESYKKILIADDSLLSCALLQRTLSAWGFDVTVAHDGNEAVAALSAEDGARLAILDWMMPGLDGVEVCRRVRRLPHLPYTYIVMLTSMTDKEELANALQAGADDFVSKPFDDLELKARLRAGQRIVELQNALRFQAMHDELTGALNRKAVMSRLEQELARGARQPAPVAVAMIDVDHFKKVNDTFGHLVGDQVLKSVVKRISSLLRPYDVIGRYGGEEFLLVLPGCSLRQAKVVAERLRGEMDTVPVELPTASLRVTISIGVAATQAGRSPEEPEALIQLADEAVYHAKEAGRNCTRLAVESLRIPGTAVGESAISRNPIV